MVLGRARLVPALVACAALLVFTPASSSWSDGTAGGSGAGRAPGERTGCGDCHGSRADMQAQPWEEAPYETPVADRVSARVLLEGDPERWDYEAGRDTPYRIDVVLETDRRPGTYNHAGFDLNVTGGRFVVDGHEDTVRITGGTFLHAGTRNASVPADANGTHGSGPVDESRSAGEVTQTRAGALVAQSEDSYRWTFGWVPPERARPHGVVFSLAFLVANDDGVETRCVRQGCNASRPYTDPDTWDWWSFLEPRKVVCERGQFQARIECVDTVMKEVTDAESRDGGGGRGRGLPAAVPIAISAVLVAVVLARRPR